MDKRKKYIYIYTKHSHIYGFATGQAKNFLKKKI